MVIPKKLTAGDTWQWDAEYSDYPATLWTATAYFENAAESFTVSSSANGTLHRFAKTDALSADIKPGRYFVTVRVTDGSSSHSVESGWSDVAVDPEATGKIDHRSWARRTLDSIEAFLEGNASTAQQSATIGGRSISRYTLPELIQWRDQLRAEVKAEEQAEAAGLGRDIKMRYRSA